MLTLISLLSYLVYVGYLVCLVLVLMKMFPKEGTVKGILGLICSLYAFIWAWQNKDSENLDKVVKGWTALIGVNILLVILAMVFATHH